MDLQPDLQREWNDRQQRGSKLFLQAKNCSFKICGFPKLSFQYCSCKCIVAKNCFSISELSVANVAFFLKKISLC